MRSRTDEDVFVVRPARRIVTHSTRRQRSIEHIRTLPASSKTQAPRLKTHTLPAVPEHDPQLDDDSTFHPAAGVAAWILPGLGHFVRGERRRGRLIMLGVMMLIIVGVLVGGVDCVDRKRDRLWFLAQSMCGPIAFAADFVNQRFVQTLPDDDRYKAIALNKPNEMGTLFVALAGLMNLVVILDALFSPRRSEFTDRRAATNHRQDEDAPPATSAAAAASSSAPSAAEADAGDHNGSNA